VKRSICGIWLALLCAGTSLAQKVDHEPLDSTQVLHVSTALNHVTVFEMRYPVTNVAVGSRAFKSDWHGNIVYVEPLEEKVETDVHIWTQCRTDSVCRYTYELDPAGPARQAIVAIDQPVVDPLPAKATATPDPPAKHFPSPSEVLASAKPVFLYGSISEKRHVAVYVKDLLSYDGRILVRYTIKNKSKKPYVPGIPNVVALEAPSFPISLVSLTNCQIGSHEVEGLESTGSSPVPVHPEPPYFPTLAPGQELTGVVAVTLPSDHTGPTVLRFAFPNSGKEPITATLVL
jgi:hypothetical protein